MPFLAVPLSRTLTPIGAVVGLGLDGGAKTVDFRVFGNIVAGSVARDPAPAFGAISLFVATGGASDIMVVLFPLSVIVVPLAIR